ncbi:PiggyBac transposable element-derived protein 4, partial [Stegodyphus mimosarum]
MEFCGLCVKDRVKLWEWEFLRRQQQVEEYRIRCAKLEAALAEHTANEANIVESDSHSQNALSMDLETALIRLEQEKNSSRSYSVFIMAPRFKGLNQDEINNLLRDLEEETFADTDSDCSDTEEECFNQSFNEDRVTDDFKSNASNLFEWRQPTEHDKANLLTFTGKPGIKSEFSETHLAVDFFKLYFSDELFKMLTRETNRYASQILELRPDISGKRKHESDWTPVTSDELQKFLGLVLLMGHVEKDSIRDYWSTDDLTDTPIFPKSVLFFFSRCQGLTQINTLLREQLETATEVNQTLTSDVHRLTKEWQHARAQLLAKESEWKEEEQDALGFKYNNRESDKVDAPERIENAFETAKLEERIYDLIERNERIQMLLEEKEKANSALCSTVEKINTSLKEKMNKTVSTGKELQANRLLQEYSGALKEISEILLDDPNCEVSPNIAVLNLIESTSEGVLSNESTLQLHALVSSVKSALQKYCKQIEERNIKISALKEQNIMQERTVEFLEDERQKMQQLNSQLSSQFESLHLKMQDYFKEDSKTDEVLENKHVSYLESMIKSLNDQIESLNSEKDHLLTVQSELQSKLQNANEEKRNIKISEQNLLLEVNKRLEVLLSLKQHHIFWTWTRLS